MWKILSLCVQAACAAWLQACLIAIEDPFPGLSDKAAPQLEVGMQEELRPSVGGDSAP